MGFFGIYFSMVQLYFLSILCNGLGGYILYAGSEGEFEEKSLRLSVNNPTFHLILGILSAVTGVLKLLSPMGIPILGDLIPAAGGLTVGLLLIFGIYRKDISEPQGALAQFSTRLLQFRKTVGVGLMITALLHFLFPQALFI